MAENHLPAPWCPRNEIIRTEHGGWISGGSASDQILPADLEPHDVIVHGDRAVIVEQTAPHRLRLDHRVARWHGKRRVRRGPPRADHSSGERHRHGLGWPVYRQ